MATEAENRLTRAFLAQHPRQAARHLESWPPEQAAALLEPLPTEEIATIVSDFMPRPAAGLLQQLPVPVAAEVLARMEMQAALSTMRVAEPELRQGLLKAIDWRSGVRLRRGLSHPGRTAAGVVEPHVLTLPTDIAASEALERVRANRQEASFYLYVVNREHQLEGVVSIKQLVAAAPDQPVSALMRTPVISLPGTANLEELTRFPGWDDFHVLPVTDPQRTFLGVIYAATLHKLAGEAAAPHLPGSLAGGLIQLWELYVTATAESMTTVASLTTGRRVEGKPEPEDWRGKLP